MARKPVLEHTVPHSRGKHLATLAHTFTIVDREIFKCLATKNKNEKMEVQQNFSQLVLEELSPHSKSANK